MVEEGAWPWWTTSPLSPHPYPGSCPDASQEKVTALNQEVDKLVSFFTAQAASTKEAMEAYTNPHLKEKPWRAQSKDDVESVFAFLENFREGRDPPLR